MIMCFFFFFNQPVDVCLNLQLILTLISDYSKVLIPVVVLAGPSVSREVLRLPPGYRRHAEGHGGFRLRARQEAEGDHGRRQAGDQTSTSRFYYLF